MSETSGNYSTARDSGVSHLLAMIQNIVPGIYRKQLSSQNCLNGCGSIRIDNNC